MFLIDESVNYNHNMIQNNFHIAIHIKVVLLEKIKITNYLISKNGNYYSSFCNVKLEG